MVFTTAITALLVGLTAATPLSKRGVDFQFGSNKVQGVNLGGWLVLEPWITPSIFQAIPGHIVIDEWTLDQDNSSAASTLQNHWDTWVTLSDFQTIAKAGFNTVRIPVGYWAYQNFNDPFIQGAAPYIDKAISWARQTGLKVWIDLHGAPGSQNGFDNSGHNGTVGWGTGSTVSDTRNIIQQIANKYAQPDYQDCVVAIEVMNEPLATEITGGPDTVVQYYKDAYGDVRVVSDTPVMIHDAFENGTFWDGTLTSPGSQNIIVDHHEYQVFTPALIDLSADEHVAQVCTNTPTYSANVDHWVVVGEWSAAMTDCAAALNGYGLGSRWECSYPYDSTPCSRSCGEISFIDTWNQTLKDNTRRYIEGQIDAYEQTTDGWVFWNFKTEASAEWDLFRLLDAGVFPSLQGRQATSVCST
ncbi:exo-1,3-beta-glucanase [Mycoblastus sanguinarius]|nr:exo-1,3-beta-glucanase [Mycoblastus sanguinarius]